MEMIMTTQTEINSAAQDLSRWKKFQSWLSIVTTAIDYDPQAHANATINTLKNEVVRLGIRVNELEERRDAS